MKISVVIPTYNRVRLLRNCLISLFNQNYPKDKFEVIVVDDGSRCFAQEVINSFTKDFKLKYVCQKHQGPAAARNLGIRESKAEIIAFIDDDCVADKDWLQNIYSLYKTYSDVEIIQGKSSQFHSSSPLSKMHQALSSLANEKRIIKSSDDPDINYALFFGPLNASIKKSAVLKYNLHFDENLITREDIDLYRRIKEVGLNIIYSEKVHVNYSYQCNNLKAFFKRHFHYGRGEYHLRQKWQGKKYIDTPPIGFTLDRLIKYYGLFWGIVIYFMSKSMGIVSHLSFIYEKHKYRTQRINK